MVRGCYYFPKQTSVRKFRFLVMSKGCGSVYDNFNYKTMKYSAGWVSLCLLTRPQQFHQSLPLEHIMNKPPTIFHEERKRELQEETWLFSIVKNIHKIQPCVLCNALKFIILRETTKLQNTDVNHDGQGCESHLKPELCKALLSLLYLFVVTWITAFVMVIVHDRVPDMKRYPPLPDIFLDNVPPIPWAFKMCEWTGTVLFLILVGVLLFHKHRFILLRRFFALSGTVFLLRCVTMLITSLSVPGAHLQCAPRRSPEGGAGLYTKILEAYSIWKGAGLSIRGVRTCGDYMFSGHTVALTMLNFFITEYTPRHLYFLHIFTWLLNMFGIFFILAAHEHYSIDVFIAFYITSRLFLYYHTLARHQVLVKEDRIRTRVWFPLFSFFESSTTGSVPFEYESPLVPLRKVSCFFKVCALKIVNFFQWSTTTKNLHLSSLRGSSTNQSLKSPSHKKE